MTDSGRPPCCLRHAVVLVCPDGTLYQAPGSASVVYAPDPDDGSILWDFVPRSLRNRPIAAANGALYVLDLEVGYLYAVDPEDGTQLWLEPYDGHPAIAPDGTAYIHYLDGILRALDFADGTELWSFDTQATPAIAPDGTVYVPSADGTLYALDPSDGSTVWSSTAPGVVGGVALAPDGTLYASSADGGFYAFDPTDGLLKWSYDLGARGYPVAFGEGGTVYVMADSNLYAVSTSPDVVEDLVCNACLTACTSDAEIGRCLPDGSEYELIETCDESSMCDDSALCVLPVPCVPHLQRRCGVLG